jgi:hypothetical protein
MGARGSFGRPHLHTRGFADIRSAHRLDNGLRVVLSRDDSAPIVAVNLWYDVGSKHE